MIIKRILKRLFQTQQPVDETIRGIASAVSRQTSVDKQREFNSMIEGMLCARELALAIDSLRTGYYEFTCSDIEIDKQLKNLEEQFGEEIDNLLNR